MKSLALKNATFRWRQTSRGRLSDPSYRFERFTR